MWPLTQESKSFVESLISNKPGPEQIRTLKTTLDKRREAIKVSQSGLAPDLFRRRFQPAMESALLDGDIESEEASLRIILSVWGKISEGSGKVTSVAKAAALTPALHSCIHFTGVSLPPCKEGDEIHEGEIVAGLSNVYLSDHLVLFYLGKPDGSTFISLNGVGSFESDVEEIGKEMKFWFSKVVKLYDASL